MTTQEPVRRSAALPPLAGSAGLAQGAYGEVGNLELVAPAAGEGLWVFWFNADRVERRSGAALGCWSGGLHVATPAPVTAARITQLRAGPAFLELLALSGDALQRWHWTPADGFVDDGTVATGIHAVSAVVEADDGDLHVLALDGAADIVHLHAKASAYPAVRWCRRGVPVAAAATSRPEPGQVGLARDADRQLVAAVIRDRRVQLLRFDAGWRPAATPAGVWTEATLVGPAPTALIGLDGEGRLQASVAEGGRWNSPSRLGIARRWRTAAAAATTLDGGRVDVVAAADDGLWHAHGRLDGSRWAAAEPLRSRVWAAPGAPVHRR